jgi:tRNA dimethylallyltransferase
MISSLQPIGLVGPTATGKSSLALCLAEALGGEIVSVDSMQVYRGLDIGTAKPSLTQRQRVPHHLIDVADLTEPFDVAKYLQLSRQAVSQIQQRGRIPILCGGTGLYLQAFIAGLGNAPAPAPALRTALELISTQGLLAELEQADPLTFSRIDHSNRRRIIRAVEVIRLTGRPFSAQRAPWASGQQKPVPAIGPIFGLARQSIDLRQRIDRRVEAMFQEGLVAETRSALNRGLGQNLTAQQAIGYRQVMEHLRGARGLSDTMDLVKQKTRQYARRQMTWFRKQPGVIWVPTDPDRPDDQLVSLMLQTREATNPRHSQLHRREEAWEKSG